MVAKTGDFKDYHSVAGKIVLWQIRYKSCMYAILI